MSEFENQNQEESNGKKIGNMFGGLWKKASEMAGKMSSKTAELALNAGDKTMELASRQMMEL